MKLEDSEKFSKAFGAEIKRMRLERGLSQLSLSELAGVSRAAVQHIEKGIRNPTILVGHALARALGEPFWEMAKRVEVQLTR